MFRRISYPKKYVKKYSRIKNTNDDGQNFLPILLYYRLFMTSLVDDFVEEYCRTTNTIVNFLKKENLFCIIRPLICAIKTKERKNRRVKSDEKRGS